MYLFLYFDLKRVTLLFLLFLNNYAVTFEIHKLALQNVFQHVDILKNENGNH